jgi:hypothetical protein
MRAQVISMVACIVSRMHYHDISLGPRLPHRWPARPAIGDQSAIASDAF